MAEDLAIPTQGAWPVEPSAPSGERILAFIDLASLEVTQPTHAEIDEIASILPAGTEVFISDIPRRSFADAARASSLIAATGMVPVPHVAVRRMESAAALERLIADCTEHGGVRKVMMVGGDYDTPAGPFFDVAAAIEDGVLQRCGIEEVSIAGYPEGHPRVSAAALAEASERKRQLLAAQGIKDRVVTQFGFDGGAMVRFIQDQRQAGVRSPVLVGMAGPTSVNALIRFAIRCGVRTLGRELVRGRSVGGALAGEGPEGLVRQLADFAADAHRGEVRPHFFSFGGGVPTARWIRAIKDGQVRPDDRRHEST